MTLAAVRAALETTLNAISPALATVWENAEAATTPTAPHQRVYLLPAPPANPEIGPGYLEQGIMQVSLYYPLGAGPKAATDRAALIRAAFPFRSTHTASGITTLITNTPEVGPARIEDDAYFLPVRIRFQAYIPGG